MEELRTWVGVIGGGLGILGAIYAWITAGSKTNAEEIKAIRAEQVELRQLLAEIHSELENRPRQGAVHELALKTEGLAGEIKAMSEKVGALANTTALIDQYIRGQK
ncbi:MAG: DUF2730 family protein [Pseudomonadota bacterium]